jgi:nicotinamide-nucleotide amidase
MKMYAKLRTSIDKQAVNVVKLLSSRNETIASAESCTGGLLSAAITAVPGASKIFGFGMCTYNNAVKSRFLGIPESVLGSCGAVSRQTAKLMAQNIRAKANATYGVGITGFAGAAVFGSSEESDEPVGLVYIGLSCPGYIEVLECHFSPKRGRTGIRLAAVEQALGMLQKGINHRATAE